MEWVTRERNKVFECNFSYLKEISDRGRGACRVGTCSEPDLGIHRGQSSTHTNRETPQGPLVKHRGQRTEPLLFDDITGPVESCANPLRKVRRLPTVQSPKTQPATGDEMGSCCYLHPHVISLSRKCLDCQGEAETADVGCGGLCLPSRLLARFSKNPRRTIKSRVPTSSLRTD